jgi:hypothetical protein
MIHLARLICAVEGEMHNALANGAPDDCPNLATLARIRAALRSIWLPEES